MFGQMTDIFVLIKLEEVSNGRGGWTLKKTPKGNIFGVLLPAQIQERIRRNAEQQTYDARAVIWKADSAFIDTETLIQVEDKTYKVISITDRGRMSDYCDLLLEGEKGNGTGIYT